MSASSWLASVHFFVFFVFFLITLITRLALSNVAPATDLGAGAADGEGLNQVQGTTQQQQRRHPPKLLLLQQENSNSLLEDNGLSQQTKGGKNILNSSTTTTGGENGEEEEEEKEKEEQRQPFKVLRVVPQTEGHLKLLEQLEVNGADMELNFWTSPVRIKAGVDVMLPAEKVTTLQRFLHKHRMHSNVIIDDVEHLIIQRERKNTSSSSFFSSSSASSSPFSSSFSAEYAHLSDSLRKHKRRLADDPNAGGGRDGEENTSPAIPVVEIDFHNYNSYAQMIAWMRYLAKRYPKIVQFIAIGKTHEGRSIEGLEIGNRGFRKRAFWIDGGIHAREWAAPHTALFFIQQLVSRYGHDEEITRLVNEITWIVVPLLNPDGYEFTRSSTNPNIRLWRKNRSPTHCVRDQWGRNRCCKGVDLNRNFDFHFKESGSSDDPCSEIYQGTHAFSEPEARAVRDAVLSNRYRGRIDGFITLHTYSQIWIHPYGHKKDSYPGDVQDLFAVGQRATAALSRLYGTKYVLGSGANTLYPASGGSEDWAKDNANIKFVYLLELRPDEKNWDGFILDERQLMPTASETWAGVRVVAEAIIERAARARRRVANGATEKRVESFGVGGGSDGGVGRALPKTSGVRQLAALTDSVDNNKIILSATTKQKQQEPNKFETKESSATVVEGETQQKGAEQQQTLAPINSGATTRKGCVDRRRACKRWVRQNEHLCHDVPIFMGDQCARSCGFC